MKKSIIQQLVREHIQSLLELNPAAHSRKEKDEHPERYCPDGKCLWKTQTQKGFNPCKKHPHLMPKSNTTSTPEQPNKEPQDIKSVEAPKSATPEQPDKEPQDSVPVAQAGSTNAPATKTDPKTSEDSEAAEQAKQLGLTHAGWGNYKDASGVVVARSIQGKLVKIEKKQPTAPVAGKPSDDPYENPSKLGNPGGAKKYKANDIQGKKERSPTSGTVEDSAGGKLVKTIDGKVVHLTPHFDVFPPQLKAGDKVNIQYKSTGSKGYHVVTPAAAPEPQPTQEPAVSATASQLIKSTPITKQATVAELKFLKKGIEKVGSEKMRQVLGKLASESKEHGQRTRGMRLEAMLDVLEGTWRVPKEEEDTALTAFLEQRGLQKVVPQGNGGPGIHPGWNKAYDAETSFDAHAEETVAKLMEMFKGDGRRLLRWLYKKLLTASPAGKDRLGQYIGILVDLVGPQIGQVDAQQPSSDGSKPNGWETWMST